MRLDHAFDVGDANLSTSDPAVDPADCSEQLVSSKWAGRGANAAMFVPGVNIGRCFFFALPEGTEPMECERSCPDYYVITIDGAPFISACCCVSSSCRGASVERL